MVCACAGSLDSRLFCLLDRLIPGSLACLLAHFLFCRSTSSVAGLRLHCMVTGLLAGSLVRTLSCSLEHLLACCLGSLLSGSLALWLAHSHAPLFSGSIPHYHHATLTPGSVARWLGGPLSPLPQG
jgi:hypothetical protein